MLLHSKSLYRLGAVEQATAHVRSCLRHDPDNDACRALFKEIRRAERALQTAQQSFERGDMARAAEQYEGYLSASTDPYNLYDVYDRLCAAHTRLKNVKAGLSWCTKLIDRAVGERRHDEGSSSSSSSDEEDGDGENHGGSQDGSQEMSSEHVVDALLHRAECHILDDNLDAAQRDAQQAQRHSGQTQRVVELLHRIERLRRMASRKNYYKALGVERSATKHEIKKAYRRLAMRYHPDRLHSAPEDERKRAEAKLREVTEAYEVLSDDDKRRRYDAGEDFDDHHQNHHYQNHFHGGFHQFFQRAAGGGGGGGGGFEFRFG